MGLQVISTRPLLSTFQHRSGSRNSSNPPRKPRRSQMPTCGVTAAKLGQKNSGKKPSAGEEQAKEAALMEAIKAAHEKVNDAKAGKKGERKEATRKAKADAKKAKKKAALRKETTEETPLNNKAHEKANYAKAGESNSYARTEAKVGPKGPSQNQDRAEELGQETFCGRGAGKRSCPDGCQRSCSEEGCCLPAEDRGLETIYPGKG